MPTPSGFLQDQFGNAISTVPVQVTGTTSAVPVQITGTTAPVPTTPPAVNQANVLENSLLNPANNAVIISIPAGRTWQGTVYVSGAAANAIGSGATSWTVGVQVSGAGATPASGTAVAGLALQLPATIATATTGASAAGSVVVPNVVAVAPAANAVSLVVVIAGAPSATQYLVGAIGLLQ